MNVVILDPAKDDLAEGFWFYESQRHDLGHYFLDTIYAEIDTLTKIRAFIQCMILHTT